MLVRMCVCCGYDGALLKGGTAPRCAHCGCDLRKRPARSYAEMEGLLGQSVPVRGMGDTHFPTMVDERRFIQRCLISLFLIMTGLMALVYLASAAMGV
jgi:hypothetical protein